MRSLRSPVRLAVWIAGLKIASGCSTVPPPVTSPLSRAANGYAMTWSVDWGYATARIQRPDGSTQVITGNGDSTWGAGDPEVSELGAVVAHGGTVSARCADCPSGVQLLDFTQNRGIAFALTFHTP